MLSFSLPQIFIILGLLAVLAELIVGIDTGFDLVIIGSIFILSGFLGNFFDNPMILLALVSVLSCLYFIFGRSLLRKKLISLTKHTNIDKLIGKTGLVIRAITPDTAGLVRVDDEDWRATSDKIIYDKQRVKITAIEGVTLIVNKIN